MQKGNTTNTVLVILLVVVVGFVVWYMTKKTEESKPEPVIEFNLDQQ